MFVEKWKFFPLYIFNKIAFLNIGGHLNSILVAFLEGLFRASYSFVGSRRVFLHIFNQTTRYSSQINCLLMHEYCNWQNTYCFARTEMCDKVSFNMSHAGRVVKHNKQTWNTISCHREGRSREDVCRYRSVTQEETNAMSSISAPRRGTPRGCAGTRSWEKRWQREEPALRPTPDLPPPPPPPSPPPTLRNNPLPPSPTSSPFSTVSLPLPTPFHSAMNLPQPETPPRDSRRFKWRSGGRPNQLREIIL